METIQHATTGILDIEDYLMPMINLRNQMKSKPEDFSFSCLEDLIMKKGIPYQVTEDSSVLPKGAKKQCFYNAAMLVMENPKDYNYVEGYAICEGMPIAFLHAWACPKDTKEVIELTWDEPGLSYQGIEFDFKQLSQIILKTQICGVLEDWENKFPALKIPDFNAEKLTDFYSNFS